MPSSWSLSAHRQQVAGDLQAIKCATGEETYELARKEFASLSFPSWEERSSSAADGRLTMFWFGLDNGPDNVGMVKRIHSSIADAPHVMFAAVWCFHHQSHLIVKAALATVEEFEFQSAA